MLPAVGRYVRQHHLGLIAILIASTGTAYAASLPKNSVTSKQVKNGSLKAKDFKAGQLPAGERGPQGLRGPQGEQGLQGLQGVQGVQGPDGPAGLNAAKYFAMVKADATVVDSSGGVQADKCDGFTGCYFVQFPADISHCAAIATQGAVPIHDSPGAQTPAAAGAAGVSRPSAGFTYPENGFESGRLVTINTASDSTQPPTPTDSSFHLAVFC